MSGGSFDTRGKKQQHDDLIAVRRHLVQAFDKHVAWFHSEGEGDFTRRHESPYWEEYREADRAWDATLAALDATIRLVPGESR